uniref:Uncharacterized protein n=1 Tax=Hanusia phi TaxID=3032 RepID=A0A7S0F313_9CRYP|mmetsp:Transcript_3616/g.8913  ORF Transcript_3616/g.8913 Transcript_3616/m.8913 type:complete len:249 (+) Transcript_3616:2-748(+)
MAAAAHSTVLLLLFLEHFFALSTAASSPSSFAKWFEGKWEVQIITTHTDGRVDDAVKTGQYLMRNEESRLVGVYFENTTEPSELTNPMRVRVEIDSEFKGVFRTARSTVDLFSSSESEEPELKFKTLFEFDFNLNKNGHYVSTGSWHGKQKGVYQFLITSPSSFVLTVMPLGGGEHNAGVQTIMGHKSIQKKFFEQYGPTALIFLAFIAMKFVRRVGDRKRKMRMQRAAAARNTPSQKTETGDKEKTT